MAIFATQWKSHVGRDFVCDQSTFGNQCAMRMGKALEDSGVSLAGKIQKRCSGYSSKFRDHKPGHIRSAQELANVFYREPGLLGVGVKKSIFNGSIDDNIKHFRDKRGMVFIMNGWGSTDHIDLWDGFSMQMKGSYDTAAYRKRGEHVWFWELK
ncbi:T6SS effector amidase Tae4 family protein [Microbulbifer taiwanensis]|uniref:T6SS effector amidase Tae4 family protein n=1 Tax=Microbulbifer taiwanensis TaxID=986746 RepID=A0ABW1YHC5_9GAMM|nr:T6SS effector amidase Tae4 family protein [Microbulbifer taiwanensis]